MLQDLWDVFVHGPLSERFEHESGDGTEYCGPMRLIVLVFTRSAEPQSGCMPSRISNVWRTATEGCPPNLHEDRRFGVLQDQKLPGNIPKAPANVKPAATMCELW